MNGEFHPDDTHRVINSASVELQTDFPIGSVYYTLNGSTPNRGSSPYTQPFTVTSNVVLRAVAFDGSSASTASSEPVQITVDADPLQLVSAIALAGNSTVGICFDQPVSSSAANPANYTLMASHGTKGFWWPDRKSVADLHRIAGTNFAVSVKAFLI